METPSEIAVAVVSHWRRHYREGVVVRLAEAYGWGIDGDAVTRLDGAPLTMADLDVARGRAQPRRDVESWQLVDGDMIPIEFAPRPSFLVDDLVKAAEYADAFGLIAAAESFDEMVVDDDNEEL